MKPKNNQTSGETQYCWSLLFSKLSDEDFVNKTMIKNCFMPPKVTHVTFAFDPPSPPIKSSDCIVAIHQVLEQIVILQSSQYSVSVHTYCVGSGLGHQNKRRAKYQVETEFHGSIGL